MEPLGYLAAEVQRSAQPELQPVGVHLRQPRVLAWWVRVDTGSREPSRVQQNEAEWVVGSIPACSLERLLDGLQALLHDVADGNADVLVLLT